LTQHNKYPMELASSEELKFQNIHPVVRLVGNPNLSGIFAVR
jgi:hypothetical protein